MKGLRSGSVSVLGALLVLSLMLAAAPAGAADSEAAVTVTGGAPAGAGAAGGPVAGVSGGVNSEEVLRLDLRQAVELALAHNVELALARQEVEAAQVALAQAEAMRLINPSPTVLLQAESGLALARRNLALSQQRVAFAVESAYYDVLRLQNLLAVLDDAIGAARRQLAVAESRHRTGVATQIDVLRAQTSLMQVEADRAQAADNLALALNRFRQTVGLAPETVVELDETVLSYEPVNITLEEALAEGLANRLELAQVRLSVEVAEKELELATNDYTPELNRVQAAIRLEQARLQLRQAEQGIALDIQRAYNALQDAHRRLAVAEQRLKEMEENWRVVQALFDAGMATDLEVLQAQTGLTEARTGAIHAVFDYNVARADFFQAIARELTDR
ncbi:MAG TPA: TolC family protein [Limnochordales bacterium]